MRRATVLDLMRQGWTLSRKASSRGRAVEPYQIRQGGVSRNVPTEVVVVLVGARLIEGSKRFEPVRYFNLVGPRIADEGS